MKYRDLLIWQYKDKPKARATIDLISDQFQQTTAGFLSLPEALNIDTAEGKNLDLIGKHVGQSRILSDFSPRRLFSLHKADYKEKQHHWGFGRQGIGGGRWYRRGSQLLESVVLDDNDYRFLIRCRIAKNYMSGTIENITQLLEFIFNPQSIAYDQYDMSITVTIRSNNITEFEHYAITQLDILPRPAGVNISFYVAVMDNSFGFCRLKGEKVEYAADISGFTRWSESTSNQDTKGKFARIL